MIDFNEYMDVGIKPLTLDSWMRGEGSFLSMDEFLYGKEAVAKKKLDDLARLQQEREDRVTIPGMLEQFFGSAIKDATFGLMNVNKYNPPSNTWESVASGAGGFAGAMIGPFAVAGKIAKVAGEVTKAGVLGSKIIREGEALAKVANVASYAVKNVAGVALGMGLTDITEPETIPERILNGAKIGAIFGAAGAANFTKSGVVNFLVRQVGGRAALAAVGQYPEGTLDPKNRAQLVWSELLNSYFLAKGITPKMILEGKYDSPSQEASVRALDRNISDLNAGVVPMKMYEKNELLLVKDLMGNPDNVDKAHSQELVGKLGAMNRRNIRMDVAWDEVGQKYKPVGNDDLLLAISDYNVMAPIHNQKPILVVKANFLSRKPGEQARLFTPAEYAYNTQGIAVLDPSFIGEVQDTSYFVGDARTLNKSNYEGFRPIRSSKAFSESLRLKDYEVLFQIQTVGPVGEETHKALPVAGGSKVTITLPDTKTRLATMGEFKAIRNAETEIIKLKSDVFILQRDIASGKLPDESAIEYLDSAGGSSHADQGGWSPEAVSRQKNNDFFTYDVRSKTVRPILGVEAIDVIPAPWEIKIQRNRLTGKRQVVAIGDNARVPAEEILLPALGVPALASEKITPFARYMKERKDEGYSEQELRRSEGIVRDRAQYAGMNVDDYVRQFLTPVGSEPIVPERPVEKTPSGVLQESLDKLDALQKFIAQKELGLSLGKELYETKTAMKMTTIDPKGKPIEINLNKLIAAANQKAHTIRRIPEYRLPKEYMASLDEKVSALEIPVDGKTLFGMLNKGETIPKLKHLEHIGTVVSELEKMPREKRLEHLLCFDNTLRPYMDPLIYDPARGDKPGGLAEKLQKMDDTDRAYLDNVLNKSWYAASAASKKDGISTLTHLLFPKFGENWLDFRKWAIAVGRRTGMPFHRIIVEADVSANTMRNELVNVNERLLPYTGFSKESQSKVREYFSRTYEGRDVKDLNLNPQESACIATINEIMAEKAPLIIKHRLKIWRDEVYAADMEDRTSDVVAFRRQNDPKVKDLLRRGVEAQETELVAKRTLAMSERLGVEPHPDTLAAAQAFNLWLVEARQANIGTISEGSYLPRNILTNRPINLEKYTEAMSIASTGKSHIKSRDPNKIEGDLDTIVDQFRNQNLFIQLANYTKQVLILEHLSPHLDALESLVNTFSKDFEAAKPKMIMKKGTEAKAFSLKDSIELYAMRLKGYPIKSGGITRILRNVQTMFFKSLTVRPMLWGRNLYQPDQTIQHRSYLYDPRYVGKKFRFASLPDRAKQWFFNRISEKQDINQEYIHSTSQSKVYDTPVLGTIARWADKASSVYSSTDEINRMRIFTKVFWKAKDYIGKAARGEITPEKMESALGVRKLDLEEIKIFREYVSKNDPVSAASWLGQLFNEGSQWVYRRYGKSLNEMTAEGESFTNLLTWSKGLTQQYYQKFKIAAEGYARAGIANDPKAKLREYRKISDAVLGMGSMYVAAQVGNLVLNTLTNSASPKYEAFDVGSFAWQFGGVTVQIAMDFTKGVADVFSSLDGTPAERQLSFENLMKLQDNVTIRQMMPFAKQILAVAESVTGRSFISPLYEAFTKLSKGAAKGETVVKRTMIEGILHGIFAADPNKSDAVRKWTYSKMLEMEAGAINETNPIMKEWYKIQVLRYRRLNDLFRRYEPVEVFKTYQRRQQLKMFNDISNSAVAESYKNQHRLFYDELLWEEGYPSGKTD